MTLHPNWYKSALCTVALSLSACGGGGGEGGTATTSAQGVLLDSAVAGIGYRAGSLSGVTDADGRFTYQPGTQVTFFIGDIEIGTVTAGAIVTPLDMVHGASDATHPTVTNILRFLQTLDDDGDPANGIQISAAVRSAAAGMSLDFAQPVSTFGDELAVQNVVSSLTAARSEGQRTLVDVEPAREHFRRTLAQITVSGNLPSGIGERLSDAEMRGYTDEFGQGLWQWVSNIDATLSMGGQQLHTQGGVVLVHTQVDGAPGVSYQDDCDLHGPLEVTDSDDGDDSLDSGYYCPNGQAETAYYRLAPSNFRIELRCDQQPLVSLSMRKLSDTPAFDNGSLTFTSSNNPDLSVSTGVCGAIGQFHNRLSGMEEREMQEASVRVVAPYQGERIELDMTFDTTALAVATYAVGGAGGVEVTVSSPLFRNTGFDESPEAVGGSVTLLAVDGTSVVGTYSLTLEGYLGDQDSVSGSFALDLN